jgi:hypothetical protein
VDKIEYNEDENQDDFIYLNIDLFSLYYDLVEMKIFFYNEDKSSEYDTFYSSSLFVENNVKTRAKIKIPEKKNMFLKIVLFSDRLNKEFYDLLLPIYFNNETNCNLNLMYECKSMYPTKVVYYEGNIVEKYNKIELVNRKKYYFAADNLLPIKDIKIVSETELNADGVYFIINDFVVPVDYFYIDNIIHFRFGNIYCIDYLSGTTYANYKEGCVFSNNIILPYKNMSYDVDFVIDNYSSFKKIVFSFKVETKGDLLGKCKISKFCITRWKNEDY